MAKKTTKAKKTKKKSKAQGTTTPAQALAMEAMQFDDFYADEIKLGKNAEDEQERRITRSAAMILWREEDIAALVRDEAGIVWGWSLKRYE